ILLLKVNVRARGDRVSAGVFEACAYDQDAGRMPADFQPAKFQVRSNGFSGGYANGFQRAAVREPQPPPYNPGGGPGGAPKGRGPAAGGPDGGGPNGGRRHLQVVEPAGDEAAPADRVPVED